MLAPVNHGSALAQLGKSRLSRIKVWVQGVELGQRILDWLELGGEDKCSMLVFYVHDDRGNDISNYDIFILTGRE